LQDAGRRRDSGMFRIAACGEGIRLILIDQLHPCIGRPARCASSRTMP
jgi:hypothetical protein